MTTTIPAKTIVTCDFCKKEGQPFKKNASIHVKEDGLDWSGAACANIGYKLDACDECIAKVNAALSALICN